MTPVEITNGPPEAHAVTYAKDQPEYIPLPVIKFPGVEGCVTTRWRLTWKERLRVLFGSGIYLSLLTFNKPLTPVKLGVTLEDVL